MTATEAPRPPGAQPRAARAAGVTLVGQALRIVVQFGSILLLARLLLPEDYGLLAIVLVVVGIGEIVRDFGLSTAAIRAPELSEDTRDALFWINTAIGAVLCVVVVACSGLLADLFDRPPLTAIACALAGTFVLNGMATQYRVTLTREMRFRSLVTADVVAQTAAAAVAIALAALGTGYWALVAQQLVQSALVLVLVAVPARWLPGRPRRTPGLRPYLTLGLHLVGTQLVNYAGNNVDTVTIGLRFDAAALGLYNRGFQLLMTPLNQLRSPATTVALPVLSRLQDDRERFDEYLRRGQLALGFPIVVSLGVVAGAAGPLVELLLGPRWSGVTPILALLAVAAASQTLAFVGLWTYLSRGLGAALFRYTVGTSVLRLVCVLTGSAWGVVGVAAGYALAACLEWPLSLWWLSRITDFPGRTLMAGALRVLACAVPAGLAAWLVAQAAALPTAVTLLLAVLAGAAVVALAAAVSRTVRADLAGVLAFGRSMVRR
ncbi:PST family polysaccharide transporter [Geodermatophilus normandii]|uniref:PST family polysaccharide transporter n=1 Tax=Geodermatophilus normandii TaxID=1137989 RepID=A0A317QIH4_9ACTN|nr:lipopolysaccharide biosynthesis protein [Geodermatophilus normandii]PWW21400.1 PST family polysaccharide transporter [Geodermatophilus normandii]